MWLSQTEIALIYQITDSEARALCRSGILGKIKCSPAGRKYYHIEPVRRHYRTFYPERKLPKLLWIQKSVVAVMPHLTHISTTKLRAVHTRYRHILHEAQSTVEALIMIGLYHPRLLIAKVSLFESGEWSQVQDYCHVEDADKLSDSTLWSMSQRQL